MYNKGIYLYGMGVCKDKNLVVYDLSLNYVIREINMNQGIIIIPRYLVLIICIVTFLNTKMQMQSLLSQKSLESFALFKKENVFYMQIFFVFSEIFDL